MNRSYIPENRYIAPTVPASKPMEAPRGVEAILVFFDLLIGILSEPAARAVIRVVCSVACFIGFLFVIGAVETGALTFGGGILLSLLLFSVAFFSVYRPRKK